MTNSYSTIADMLKQQDGDGKITSKIIEMLAPSCDLINDAFVAECNNKTSNISTIRTAIPEPEFRTFYRGAAFSKSGNNQVTDTCGQLTDYSRVDKSLCDIQKNPAQYRLNEAKAHLLGFHKKIMKSLLYGDMKKDPLGFDGLSTRFGKKSSVLNSVGAQIVDGGASSGDCTSVFLITWGENDTKLLYPEGTTAGIKHVDKGQETVHTAEGKAYEAYIDYYEWWVGLAMGNYKSSARLANISVSALRAGTVDVENLLLDLYYAVDDDREKGLNNSYIYANKEVIKALHKKILNKTNVNVSYEQAGGKPIMKFIDIPLRSCKEVKLDEAVVA